MLTSNDQQISSPQPPTKRHQSAKPVSTVSRPRHANGRQQADTQHVDATDFLLGDLHSSRQADADAQNDRRKDVHQTADDQARTEAWGSGVEDLPCGYGGRRSGLLTVRARGRTSQGCPVPGKLPGVGLFRVWMAKGWSGRG